MEVEHQQTVQTVSADAPAEQGINELQKALACCGEDRNALEHAVGELLRKLWTESIYVVDEVLGEIANPEKAAALRTAYKNRILNEGNRLKRLLKPILSDYMVKQVFVRAVVTRVSARSNDPWGLPEGVKMPERKQTR
jgi:hypothetical protein